jgi:NADH pyrophosphatase NudC (nudix superfamily)
MRKGELIEQALRRNVRRELHLDIAEDRLRQIIGYYSQIWDTRASEPMKNGCHVFTITTAVHLTAEEQARIHLNEEYTDSQWVNPWQVIENAGDFHPCLVQIARDIIRHEPHMAALKE